MANVNNDRKKWLKILGCIILIVLIFLWERHLNEQAANENGVNNDINIINTVDGELVMAMIDVGQGDSILFVQNGQVALIDCGTKSGGTKVIEYLNEQGIKKIDYLFGTHPHDDHMGGMLDVISSFDIGKIVIPEIEKGKVTSNWYKYLTNELSDSKYDVETAKLGAEYQLGDAKMKIIGPISKQDNLNNYSTVIKVSFGEMDVIMTGDAEKTVEKEILKSGENIDAEILKVGHHGSDTSSSTDFIDAISPDYAMISAGLGNKYDHPIKSTMDNLKKRNIPVYRTDESGTIVATITENDVQFNSKPGDYLSGPELEERSKKK